MPDSTPEDRSDEMQHDLDKLEDHIEEAGKKLEDRKADAGIVDDVAGDPPGEQDVLGGEDPEGTGDADERLDEEAQSPT